MTRTNLERANKINEAITQLERFEYVSDRKMRTYISPSGTSSNYGFNEIFKDGVPESIKTLHFLVDGLLDKIFTEEKEKLEKELKNLD